MEQIKAIAMYLPQFHRVSENDMWWGEGFTEWTTVKNSTVLFDGHNQPREPLHDDYYNLLDKSTMEWQAALAKKAEIHGFCFYHYWFKDGRQILEKPAENLLKWKDIHLPFCFSWANESWARSWSNVGGKNVWADKFETGEKINDNPSGLLLEQRYGSEQEWQAHFEYLLPFFKDERYIKIDGKPIFIIHKPDVIPSLKRMINYWKKLAAQYGTPNMYVIGRNCSENKDMMLDARIMQSFGRIEELDLTQGENQTVKFKKIKYTSYDSLWSENLNKIYDKDKKTFLCGVVDYDDTPRRGVNGTVVLGTSVDKFKKYYEKLVIKSMHMKNEFVFINAWNEWGEGMYLEPDKKNGYGYLEAVQVVMRECNKNAETNSIGKGENVDFKVNGEMKKNNINEEKDRIIAKFKGYFDILHQWLTLKEQGNSLDKYLINNGYRSIAIYGMGVMGKHLKEELKNSQVKIAYAIDEKADMMNFEFQVLNLEEGLPPVDAIIVTATFAFDEIEDKLMQIIPCPIISLEEVICES